MQSEKFDLWCIVELFGHQKIAGRCTEQNLAGANMLRVDVPETTRAPAFTRFFGASAIYAINPVDDSTVKAYAERLQIMPIDSFNMSALMEKHMALQQINVLTPSQINDFLGDDEGHF